ncbi:hypothetical protein KGQ20_43785 [Catenulispora sp. NF23]|uniref:mannosyltransferase family protein n=1 Tax=Catenulispora pinistramenti TaxID=2705254 RepID=UPI001BA845E3|nr:mannosyltransferase family protein [Catenulispora pinistramenti]MBS2539686.1 hypothetical protein [Catenulispora pinistramenti]
MAAVVQEDPGPAVQDPGSRTIAAELAATFRRAVLNRTNGVTAGVYLGLHLISVLSLLWLLHVRKQSLNVLVHTPPHAWDSTFYIEVARGGYQRGFDYAFFPLYPVLLRGVETVSGLSYLQAGVLASVIAGTVAALGIRFVGERVAGPRAGLVLVALFALAPTAVVQVAPYGDVLFVAFAAWALHALLRRAWLTAGVLAFFGGLTRPSASALIATVGLVALVAIIRRQDGWRPWAGAAIAPLGMLGYMAAVGRHFGHLDAYFKVQRSLWNNWFDGGATTFDEFSKLVDGRLDNPSTMELIAILAMVTVPFLLALMIRRELPWELVAYCALVAVLVLGSHRSITTTPRELMPAFPLLIPVARTLSRSGTRGLVVCFVAVAVMSAWFAWYLPIQYGVP